MPKTTRPIIIIGSGNIVLNAHLPAYKKAGFPVLGVYDINTRNALKAKEQFDVEIIKDLDTAFRLGIESNAVFDIAVPASQVIQVLKEMPPNVGVIIQKPMGETIDESSEILKLCNEKELTACINFQLRFAPFILAAKYLLAEEQFGEITNIEIKICIHTPWHLWDFLKEAPRVEILYHSIHYIDLIRSLLGEPYRIMAKTTRRPDSKVASTCTNIILDYGSSRTASVHTNHDHNYGTKHQHSYIKIETENGAIYIKLGLLLDYPKGVPDVFEYCILEPGKTANWKEVQIKGSWFPEAFIGSMASLLRFMEGSENHLPTSVTDAFKTMELVEKAYKVNEL